jgi:hypothetical protein
MVKSTKARQQTTSQNRILYWVERPRERLDSRPSMVVVVLRTFK